MSSTTSGLNTLVQYSAVKWYGTGTRHYCTVQYGILFYAAALHTHYYRATLLYCVVQCSKLNY
jgi:hypothetical protein